MSAPQSPPILFNCTRRETKVSVNGELRVLPRGPVPSIVDDLHGTDETETFALDLEGEEHYELTLGPGKASLVMMLPDPMPGVYYLVDADILVRLPHRRDLCAPARYRAEITGEAGDRHHESWLIQAYSSLDLVSEDTSVLRPEDLHDAVSASDPEPAGEAVTPPTTT